MIDKFNKNGFLLSVLLLVLILPGIPATVHAYSVSGVVEFSYTDTTSKSGKSKITESYSVQHYALNVGSYLIDPRLLRYSASAGYMYYSSDTRNDTRNLTYSLSASLLPGKIFSADLYASRNTQTIKDNNTAVSGFDVVATSYGGSLSLKFDSIGKAGNNGNIRNNNNNNNNNSGGSSFVRQYMPDVFLSQNHLENESLSQVNPFHETRDNTNVELRYRSNSLFDVSARSQLEKYENIITRGTYDIQSNYFGSNIRISPDSRLRLDGSTSDKTYEDYFSPGIRKEKTTGFLAGLAFAERERLSQDYSYSYSAGKADSSPVPSEGVQQDAKALMRYRLTDAINAHGGLVYHASEFKRDPNPALTGIGGLGLNDTLQSAGVQAGVNWSQEFRTASLGTWNLSSSYTGNAGSNDYTRLPVDLNGDGIPDDLNNDGVPDEPGGSGGYYSNGIGLTAGTGWGQETLSASYTRMSYRDGSPLNNDYRKNGASVTFKTTRIPRTRIHGTGSYSVQEYTTDQGALLLQLPSALGNTQFGSRRETTYSITADYSIITYLSLNAGANRGQTTTRYTIATQNPSTALTDDTTVYGALNFIYPLTRNLTYKANYGRDVRTSNITDASVVTDRFRTSFDLSIRRLFFSAEYSWQKSTPDKSLPYENERLFLTLKRPF